MLFRKRHDTNYRDLKEAPVPEGQHLLEVDDLKMYFHTQDGVVKAVNGVSYTLDRGETLGVVGESGSGKSVTSLAIMGLIDMPPGRIEGGDIRYHGESLLKMSDEQMGHIRGNGIAMIFQDPMTSLNPVYTIGRQLGEGLRLHRGYSRKRALERSIELLRMVGIPNPEQRVKDYPHEFSGGMRQRVMIAMALVCQPRILIADEPTTALDVTTQMQILDLIDELRDEYKMGVILITHDLGVVAGHTDRVAVMYAGRIVETAPTKTLFTEPKHRYTSSLMAALPERALAAGTKLFSIPGAPPSLTNLPVGCRFAARCLWATDECRAGYPDLSGDETHTFSCFHPVQEGDESPAVLQGKLDSTKAEETASVVPQISHEVLLDVKEASREYESAGSSFFKREKGVVSAVDRVSITVKKGETYGLVGESGCGKSTVGRLIAGLEPPSGGAIELDGRDLATLKGRDAVRIHRDVQMMFQDSYAAMDPRMRIDQILAEPMSIQKTGNARQIAERIMEILEQVGLTEEILDRYPHEFSGGQLQRIGFARSLTLAPDLIVADEPVSALDVSVQAQVLNLMKDLQQELGLSYLFISHDLAVVQYMADRIGVMYLGRIVEEGPAHEVVQNPKHPYTKALIDSIPVPDPEFKHDESAIKLTGEPPSAVNPPEGCRFRPRCPFAGEECKVQPMLTDETHRVACHHPLLTLSVKEEVNA